MIFEEKLFCHLLGRNFAVLAEFLTSDQSVGFIWQYLIILHTRGFD